MARINTHSVSVTSSNFFYASPHSLRAHGVHEHAGMLPKWRNAISGGFASQDNQPPRLLSTTADANCGCVASRVMERSRSARCNQG